MAVFLGIDTGGTYTDAVLLDEGKGILAKAKALTTRDDLAEGIGQAIDRALIQSDVPASEVALVSLSTTLATNALVEGQGGRVCLVFIGFAERDLDRAGLREALGNDPVILLAGGHDSFGNPQASLDLAGLGARLPELADSVSGFAVAGHFGVRNPAHELAVREAIHERCGLPVTCSHELSAKLDGPRRALTCLLNARLISLIDRLIHAMQSHLDARGIRAPLMVVRGDGALISVDLAKSHPVETILSGPAASLIGAAYLTGRADAVVSDIGGTTTDIAVLKDGRPRTSQEGATVGGFRTMVEAVDMTTIGLGGDSEVSLSDDVGGDGAPANIKLGPRRVIPLSLLAQSHGSLVHETLARQLRAETPGRMDGRFVVPLRATSFQLAGLGEAERKLYDQASAGPVSADRLAQGNYREGVLNRLVTKGLLMISALTPSDAAHVAGHHDAWDKRAAVLGADLFARTRDRFGRRLAPDAETLCQRILSALVRRSAEAILDTCFAADGYEGAGLSRHVLAAAALERRGGMVRMDMGLNAPLIGLGASAATYYPGVAGLLNADSIVPEHADVANAVGAVVGQVRIMVRVTVTQPQEGLYRVHLPGQPKDHTRFEDALSTAERHAAAEAKTQAEAAGAATVELSLSHSDKTATIEGKEVFIESEILAVAAGRPRLGQQ
jgi:N-methylhydantoinase A/oxoprolinase/acetone carboxylase beta subunit